jgi:hypothetical protein
VPKLLRVSIISGPKVRAFQREARSGFAFQREARSGFRAPSGQRPARFVRHGGPAFNVTG